MTRHSGSKMDMRFMFIAPFTLKIQIFGLTYIDRNRPFSAVFLPQFPRDNLNS